MSFFDDLRASIDALESALGRGIDVTEVPGAVVGLSDDAVVAALEDAAAAVRLVDCVKVAACGAIAARSSRDAGHRGVSQIRGHRSPVSLIQELTGTTRADATKQVKVGEALLAATLPAPDADDTADVLPAPAARPWHAVLSDALLHQRLTKDQQAAILRGLGEPARGSGDAADVAAAEAAWELAAEQLIDEATQRTVEELERGARTVRDILDPVGAANRFDRRFETRGFRIWTDSEGGSHGTIAFDDEMALWVRTAFDAAMRPRRGGPRFVDAGEMERAEQLEKDPRTNDQLAYDLLMDVLRAGVLADAEAVFGTRQAGVRVVVTAAALDADAEGEKAVALAEDDSTALPAWLARQRACDTGTVTCTVDSVGNPLDLGREQRLFSPKQRVALAIRDGGCRWRGCDRPASYCEAHHCDHWSGGGRTDVDRGILLCRYHHMNLHNGGWRIDRDDAGAFVLHPPPDVGRPYALEPRLVRRYAWGDLQPPPQRFRPAA